MKRTASVPDYLDRNDRIDRIFRTTRTIVAFASRAMRDSIGKSGRTYLVCNRNGTPGEAAEVDGAARGEVGVGRPRVARVTMEWIGTRLDDFRP